LACSLLPLTAQAFVGDFPVCDKRPQYVRIELREGFPPAECPAVSLDRGNPIPALLLVLGSVYVSCALYAPGTERATIIVPAGGPDAILGHELRHAFAPHEFHPALLPFVTESCAP